ncbi:hypothetical protein AWR36_015080 [Microbulbifer flavimaris]|uniref:Uncharacterized protein n=1 Tax=Microbulbifer flavimaris TaxID=1781068 RepID=A0ABX4HVQ0_9GAMM|nr:hypothetical protein AVO43_15035 [Microbulbifer sp. ZGT114]PCO04194.1 hypothetical protein AWR36_015080 [Microbulbifer flavimaris]
MGGFLILLYRAVRVAGAAARALLYQRRELIRICAPFDRPSRPVGDKLFKTHGASSRNAEQ